MKKFSYKFFLAIILVMAVSISLPTLSLAVISDTEQKLTDSDGEMEDNLGNSMSISGDTVVAGSQVDDDNVNGSGSVHIFSVSGVGDELELAVDFGANGLWNYDGSTWSKKTSWNPEDDLAGWSGGFVVDFGTNGLWNYDGTVWSKKTSWNAGSGGMCGWSGGLAVDFDGNGLWNYDGTTWSKKTSWDPGAGGLAGWTGGLAVDFDSNGLWNYDGTTWSKKTNLNPEEITALGNGFAADFGTSGLWYYDGTTWSKKTSWDAENLTDNEALSLAPLNQFNIGDSIGEGEAADGTIGEVHHDKVWSTGYDVYDIVYSLNERFEDADPVYYNENSATMDSKYNKAISGAVMSDFVNQANNVVAEATAMGGAGMITILLGNNDVCKSTLNSMTDPVLFESQYRAGLDILAGSFYTKYAEIHVSSIPDIYWLWVAKKDSSGCRLIWWFGQVCQALLQNPGDDCESVASRDDPDIVYPGDGSNCQRRKEFHRRIREVYNPILKNVLDEYINNGTLPNAYYVDIFDVKFRSSEVNNGDCFHPSTAGHKLLADEEWCRSFWSIGDPLCTP